MALSLVAVFLSLARPLGSTPTPAPGSCRRVTAPRPTGGGRNDRTPAAAIRSARQKARYTPDSAGRARATAPRRRAPAPCPADNRGFRVARACPAPPPNQFLH